MPVLPIDEDYYCIRNYLSEYQIIWDKISSRLCVASKISSKIDGVGEQ